MNSRLVCIHSCGAAASSQIGLAEIGTRIAELEDLIASRKALGATLRPAAAGFREKMATVQRANWRKGHVPKAAEPPVEDDYIAAVADLAAVGVTREY